MLSEWGNHWGLPKSASRDLRLFRMMLGALPDDDVELVSQELGYIWHRSEKCTQKCRW